MRKFLLTTSIAALVGVAGHASAAPVREDFSVQSFSYHGVSDCGDLGRQASEADQACRAQAPILYGTHATVTFTAPPTFQVSAHTDDVCGKYILGICVSRKRECTGTFLSLVCHVEVDRH